MTRICFPSGLKQASKSLAIHEQSSILPSDSNGPEIQCPVSESQTYEVVMYGGDCNDDIDDDVETKVFSSGDKTVHLTESLWCSATKIFFGH